MDRYNIFGTFALAVSGIVISCGLYLFVLLVFVGLLTAIDSVFLRSFASLYVSSTIYWIAAHECLFIIVYLLYMKWAGSGKTILSMKKKISLAVFVYYTSILILYSGTHRY